MTDLFFFEPSALHARINIEGGMSRPVALSIQRSLERDPIPKDMPFFVDNTGVQPVPHLNLFLRQLPARGSPSPRTWEACARHIHGLIQYLEEEWRGLSLLDVTHEHLVRFHSLRRITGNATVLPDTWNQTMVWIEQLFRWMRLRGHVATLPLQPKSADGGKDQAQSDAASPMRERTSASTQIRCTSVEDFLYFRDVGLGGLLGVGEARDPEFRGRNAQRDTAFADFLVGTGLRLTEGCSVLLPELPRSEVAAAGVHNLKLHVAAGVAKGQRARDVWLPVATLERIEDYMLDRRLHAVTERLRGNGYDTACFEPVMTWDPTDHSSGVRMRDFERVDPENRRRLVTSGERSAVPFVGPGVIWLSEDGGPMHPGSFDTIFRRARERCRAFGRDIPITPHVLRHNYALGMLSGIMRALLSARERSAFLELAIDPLGELARLMGHRSVDTTRKYLTYLREADEIISEAVDSWAVRFAATRARRAGDA